MKKPITTKDLFEEVIIKVKANDRWPDIIDYALPERNPVQLKDYHFDPSYSLKYGSCEGIYLNLWLEGKFEPTGDHKRIYAGTIKTLREDDEAMQTMGILLADLTIETWRWENENIENLDYGYSVKFDTGYAFRVPDAERARQEAARELKCNFYPHKWAIIESKETGKTEKIWKAEIKEALDLIDKYLHTLDEKLDWEDLGDLTKIPLACTNYGEHEEVLAEVFANLDDKFIFTLVNSELFHVDRFDSINEMIETLRTMSFEGLVPFEDDAIEFAS